MGWTSWRQSHGKKRSRDREGIGDALRGKVEEPSRRSGSAETAHHAGRVQAMPSDARKKSPAAGDGSVVSSDSGNEKLLAVRFAKLCTSQGGRNDRHASVSPKVTPASP